MHSLRLGRLATIFFVLLPMTFAVTSSADAVCIEGFQELGSSVTRATLAKEYGEKARNAFRAARVVAETEQNRRRLAHNLLLMSIHREQFIAPDVLPKDPHIRELAVEANRLLQASDVLESFVLDVANKTAIARRPKPQIGFEPVTRVTSSEDILAEMAHTQGWGPVFEVQSLYGSDGFRREVLARGHLFFDRYGSRIGHPASAHLLQWLLLTPRLDARYGRGSAKQLFEYLSSPEGIELWSHLLDRTREHIMDARGPAFFNATGLTGYQKPSWFGLD